MDVEKLYNEALDTLKEAYDAYKTPTNNQQAMPGHLMRVARLFGDVCENVKKLEKRAIKESRRWTKEMFGKNNNNSNSNSNKNNNSNNNNNSRRKTKKTKRNHNNT